MTEEHGETEEREQREQLDDIRIVLGNAVTRLQSVAYSEYAAELSFTSVLAQAITDIEEDESDIRPGRINELLELKQSVSTMVARARELPGELFSIPADDEDES